MDLSKVISDAVDNASYKTPSGIIDLSDAYHMYLVGEELKERLDTDIVNKVLFGEAEDEEEKEYYGIGGNIYIKAKDKPKDPDAAVPDNVQRFKKDGEKYTPVDDDETGEEPKSNLDFSKQKDIAKDVDPEIQEPQPGEIHHGTKMPTKQQVRTDAQKRIDKTQKVVDRMPEGKEKENAQKVLDMLQRYADAETKEEKIAILQEMQASGLIQRNDRGSGTKKIYFSGSTGLHYKEFAENSALHREIAILDEEQYAETGIGLLDTKDRANYGKKKMAPMNLHDDQESDVPVRQNEDGSVTIGEDPGTTIKKLPDPDEDKNADNLLRERIDEAYTKDGVLDEKAYKKAKRAIKRHNRLVEEVEKVIAAGGGSLKCIDPIPGVQPDTPENRDKLKNKTADRIADRLEELAGANLSESQKKILKRLRNLKSPPLSQEEYEAELMSIATVIQKDLDFSTGYADLVETLSYMRHLNRGSVAYLPSAGNFPLGDVLTFPNNESQPDLENDSPEDIATKMQAIHISVDNRSIKKGEGGASSTHTKVDLTEFVDMEINGNAIPAEEVKEDQKYLSDKGYDEIFGVRGNQKKGIKPHTSTPEEVETAHDKIRDQADKYDVDITSDAHLAARKKRVDSSIDKIKRDREKAKLPALTPEEEAFLRKKHEAYYDLGKVQSEVYNRQLDAGATQLYTNEVWAEDDNGNAITHETDGIECKAYLKFEYSAGWLTSGKPNNKAPSRFHNKKRDEQGNLVDC